MPLLKEGDGSIESKISTKKSRSSACFSLFLVASVFCSVLVITHDLSALRSLFLILLIGKFVGLIGSSIVTTNIKPEDMHHGR